MKARVGVIFRALRQVQKEKEERLAVDRVDARDKKVVGRQDQLIDLIVTLCEVLEGCDAEIDLPPGASSALIPFLTSIETRGTH